MADVYGSPTSTPPLSRGSSFQRMLELEKRYKLERLHNNPDLPDLTPSPPPEPLSPRVPLRARRSNSLSQQQQDLMLKAVRRSIALPPLSISIPQPNGDRKRKETRAREELPESEPEPDLENVEPLQKSVKFLAPDSDEESDQSSICQSPSWEGYGQKKKEKKMEAERKRKAKEQKEQAEREAKAAKKRASSRLSKSPPVVTRQLPTLMERSNSAPLLESHNFLLSNRGQYLPTVDDEQDFARPASQQNSLRRSGTPDSAEMLDSASRRFIGGLKLQQERAAAIQNVLHSQSPYGNNPESRQRMHKSYSAGPGMDMSTSASGSSSIRNDSRSSRESCPPSASRTPMLRHTSAQTGYANVPRGRDMRNHPATSTYPNIEPSPQSISISSSLNDRGRNDGYVRHQREQSTDRALAVLIDDQLTSRINATSSTRSSSQHTSHSSLSQDVKTVPLKLSGHQLPTPNKSEHTSEGADEKGDYFTFQDQPQHPAAADILSPPGSLPASMRSKVAQQDPASARATQEMAAALAPTVSNSSAAKARSLKDVARAALHMTPVQVQPQTAPVKPTIKPPPYYLLRAKFSSSSSVTKVNNAPAATSAGRATEPTQSQSGPGPTTKPNQPGCRVSEGSSSSSNYDDASPLPSPVTTPDTSRPQSAKGLPAEAGLGGQARAEDLPGQDDSRTLRQSSEEDGEGGSSDVTPRMERHQGEQEMPPEDRWSRTAMPMEDIDFDDAGTTVSDYTDAEEVPSKIASAPAQMRSGTGKHQDQQRFDEPGDSFGRIALPKSHSDHDLPSKSMDTSSKDDPLIPHRSKARGQPRKRPATSSAEQHLDECLEKEVADEERRESEQKPKKLRKQKTIPEPKQEKETMEDAELVDRSTDECKSNMAVASANTSLLSARFMSPIGGFVPSFGFSSNPYFVDFSEVTKAGSDQATLPVRITATQITFQAQAPTPASTGVQAPIYTLERPVAQVAAPERSLPAPEPPKAVTRAPSAPTQSTEPKPTPLARSTTAPVSILKPSPPQAAFSANSIPGPIRGAPPVLSAIPKHLQPQVSARPPAVAASPEQRMSPIAKMFVECCNCKFYHDMPSKLYECMAKPDAVVEDKLLGISGAITTMVKCPWCLHNMSTKCCAGYAAVVYIKEKLH